MHLGEGEVLEGVRADGKVELAVRRHVRQHPSPARLLVEVRAEHTHTVPIDRRLRRVHERVDDLE